MILSISQSIVELLKRLISRENRAQGRTKTNIMARFRAYSRIYCNRLSANSSHLGFMQAVKNAGQHIICWQQKVRKNQLG